MEKVLIGWALVGGTVLCIGLWVWVGKIQAAIALLP